MAWESLGDIGSGQMPEDEPWIMLCHKLAKTYLLEVCGNPPDACKLGTFWQDHDLGSYPSFGLYREYDTSDSDQYYSKCEAALEKFNSAIDWYAIMPEFVDDEDEEIDDEESKTNDYDDGDEFALKLAITAAELFMKHPDIRHAEAMALLKVIKALEAIQSNIQLQPETQSDLLFQPETRFDLPFQTETQCTYLVDYLTGDREYGESNYIKFELNYEGFQIIKGSNTYANSEIVNSFSEVCFFMNEHLRSGYYDLSILEQTIVEYLHLGAEVIVTGGN